MRKQAEEILAPFNTNVREIQVSLEPGEKDRAAKKDVGEYMFSLAASKRLQKEMIAAGFEKEYAFDFTDNTLIRMEKDGIKYSFYSELDHTAECKKLKKRLQELGCACE